MGALKGKKVRRGTIPVTTRYAAVPSSILTQYNSIKLAVDIMFIHKMPFFVAISRYIKFSTAELLANQQITTITKAIKHVYQAYIKRGFRITKLLVDGQFEGL